MLNVHNCIYAISIARHSKCWALPAKLLSVRIKRLKYEMHSDYMQKLEQVFDWVELISLLRSGKIMNKISF